MSKKTNLSSQEVTNILKNTIEYCSVGYDFEIRIELLNVMLESSLAALRSFFLFDHSNVQKGLREVIKTIYVTDNFDQSKLLKKKEIVKEISQLLDNDLEMRIEFPEQNYMKEYEYF